MADKFPSLEDFSEGEPIAAHFHKPLLIIDIPPLGQIGIKGNSTSGHDDVGGEDFLSRERALLGDDADQFASSNDHAVTATAEDAEDDLLGESYDGTQAGGDDIGQFESSFPAVDNTRNEVWIPVWDVTELTI